MLEAGATGSFSPRVVDALNSITAGLGARLPSVAAFNEGSAVFDLEATRARLAYDDCLLRDMVQFFFEDGRQLLIEVREGVAAARWDDVERAAHSLKGLAANFGAPATVAAARALETAARTRDLDAVPETLAMVEHETGRLMEALGNWAANDSAPSADASFDC